MKKILFLSAGIAALFLQTASAQYPSGSVNGLESWENTLDGWTVDPLGKNPSYTGSFSTAFGVTEGSYSLALTGTAYPNYAQMLSTPSSTNLTAMLGDAVSINLSVYIPDGAFDNWLEFDFDVANVDVNYPAGFNNIPGYVSLNGFDNYVDAYHGGGNVQTNISVPIPAGIAAQLALSTNPTTLYIQIGGSYTAGNETMYLDSFQIVPTPQGTVPTPTKPVAVPTDTFYAQSASGVILSESSHGVRPLYYQWQTDGGSGGSLTGIPDATNKTYAFNTTIPGTYKFDVIVTNSYNGLSMATSTVAQVFVLPASVPILTTDINPTNITPTNIFGFVGGNVSFYANFGLGTMPLTNQWLFSSTGSGYTPVAGNGDNPWTCTNVQPSSAGFYKLSATNSIGGSNSTPGHLTALADPGAPGNIGANAYSYCIYTNHPWAYWKFEETNDTLHSSMQAYDYSGNNFDATYGHSDGSAGSGCRDGGQAWAQNYGGPGSSKSSEAYGTDHYAGFPSTNGCAELTYNHANGYLTVPPLNLNTNTVTFTMWIRPSSGVISAGTGLFMNRNGSDGAGIGFGTVLDTNGTSRSMPCLSYTWNTNNSTTSAWNTGLYPIGGIWSFVACVITPTNTMMYLYYVNGTQTNLLKSKPLVISNYPEAFGGLAATRIGGDSLGGDGQTFDGCIDEVAVFTNAMSQGQVQDLFLKALNLASGVAPAFTTQPVTSFAMYQYQTLQLTAAAGGIPDPNLQWQFSWDKAKWTNVANNVGIGEGGETSTTLYMTNFPDFSTYGGITNFRCIAVNGSGSVTSVVAVVNLIQILANNNLAPWTVNFAVATANQNGRSTAYSGRGVLGTGSYWNVLNGDGGQVTNVTSFRDSGAIATGIRVSTPAGHNVGSPGSSLWTGVTNNMLLDTYAQVLCANATDQVPFLFSNLPNGKYNLALYGTPGNWRDRAIKFTVLTNGVVAGTAAMTNLQDVLLLPNDNTAVFTNLIVMNGSLEVDLLFLPCPAHTNTSSGECEFNGAQLQLLKYAPQVTNFNASTHTFGWAGGGLMRATNVMGPWVTNPGVAPYTLTPTGYMQFYRVYNPKW